MKSDSTSPDWFEHVAESIVDAFVNDTGADDLLRLQRAITAALRYAFGKE